jgi:hypothetical protein
MGIESLSAALEREHHKIDAGIAAFTASQGNPQSLTCAIRALRRHIYLEEEFLYPRADDVLSPAAVSRLQAFPGSGQLPEGRVYLKARPVTLNAGR